jgi:hypothetical protein
MQPVPINGRSVARVANATSYGTDLSIPIRQLKCSRHYAPLGTLIWATSDSPGRCRCFARRSLAGEQNAPAEALGEIAEARLADPVILSALRMLGGGRVALRQYLGVLLDEPTVLG